MKKSLHDQGIKEGNVIVLKQGSQKAGELLLKVSKKKKANYVNNFLAKTAKDNGEYIYLFPRNPRKIVQSFKTKLNQQTPGTYSIPMEYSASTLQVMLLQSSLVASNSYLFYFTLNAAGLPMLFEILTSVHPSFNNFMKSEIQNDSYRLFLDKVVWTIHFILNQEYGLTEALTIPYSLRKLITQLDPQINDPSNFVRRNLVLEIFTAVCLYGDTHSLVTDAFKWLAKMKLDENSKEKEPSEQIKRLFRKTYSILVEYLHFSTYSSLPFKVTTMGLINAIINGEEELKERIELRNSFIEAGLSNSLLAELTNIGEAQLNLQINLYESDKLFDDEEFKYLNSLSPSSTTLSSLPARKLSISPTENPFAVNLGLDEIITQMKKKMEEKQKEQVMLELFKKLYVVTCTPHAKFSNIKPEEYWKYLSNFVMEKIFQQAADSNGFLTDAPGDGITY